MNPFPFEVKVGRCSWLEGKHVGSGVMHKYDIPSFITPCKDLGDFLELRSHSTPRMVLSQQRVTTHYRVLHNNVQVGVQKNCLFVFRL
jgi:hypothetical protein